MVISWTLLSYRTVAFVSDRYTASTVRPLAHRYVTADGDPAVVPAHALRPSAKTSRSRSEQIHRVISTPLSHGDRLLVRPRDGAVKPILPHGSRDTPAGCAVRRGARTAGRRRPSGPAPARRRGRQSPGPARHSARRGARP